MSENAPENTTETEQQQNESTPQADPTWQNKPAGEQKLMAPDEVGAKIAEAKRKEREKFADYDDLLAKAKRLDEIEEQSKSEQQRAAEAADRAQRERDNAVADGLRWRAAAKHKIGEDYFDLLGTGDESTIDDRAGRIAELLSAREERDQLKEQIDALKNGRSVGTSRPTADLRPGASPTEVTTEDDAYPAHWITQSAASQ